MDLWGTIVEERESLLATFETLTDEQWRTPSLCGDWTVHQLLGHLVVGAHPPRLGFAVEFVKARGSFDRANDALARAEAQRSPAELITRYRERLVKRVTPPGFGQEAPLTDILLHSLDARIPLGLPTERPADRYAHALKLLLSAKGERIFVPKGRPKVRWAATDLPWTAGEGPTVEGSMQDLAVAASGRRARLDGLSGPGKQAVVAWLSR